MHTKSAGSHAKSMPIEGDILAWSIWIAESLARAGVEEAKAHRIAVATARHCFKAGGVPKSSFGE